MVITTNECELDGGEGGTQTGKELETRCKQMHWYVVEDFV